MQLTDNFEASEFFVSESFPHLVSEWSELTRAKQERIKQLAKRLQGLRDLLSLPIEITSGYRDKVLNTHVKGSSNSYHTKGMAADIEVHGMSAKNVQETLKHWDGGLGSYSNFTHIDLGPKRRWRG